MSTTFERQGVVECPWVASLPGPCDRKGSRSAMILAIASPMSYWPHHALKGLHPRRVHGSVEQNRQPEHA